MRPFHDIAADYCSGLEQPEQHPDFIGWLQRMLAELQHAGFCLPRDGIADAGSQDFQSPDGQQIAAALPKLPLQYYLEIFNPLEVGDTNQPVMGDLYDDLGDIFRDLSEGLFIHRTDSPAEAERYWGQSFWYHWGEHATSALRVLYWSER